MILIDETLNIQAVGNNLTDLEEFLKELELEATYVPITKRTSEPRATPSWRLHIAPSHWQNLNHLLLTR
jgi:hypothetical protein